MLEWASADGTTSIAADSKGFTIYVGDVDFEVECSAEEMRELRDILTKALGE